MNSMKKKKQNKKKTKTNWPSVKEVVRRNEETTKKNNRLLFGVKNNIISYTLYPLALRCFDSMTRKSRTNRSAIFKTKDLCMGNANLNLYIRSNTLKRRHYLFICTLHFYGYRLLYSKCCYNFELVV